MHTFQLRSDLERHSVDGYQLPLGLEPVEVEAPQQGYTVEFVEGDDAAPDIFRFYAVVSFERLAPLIHDLFELLPDEVFPLVEIGSKDAFRTVDIYSATEGLGFDDFMDAWREFEPVLLEDAAIGAGAQSDEPYMEVFVDSWKGIEVQIPVDLREAVEQILARHGLDEVTETWPPDIDQRPEPPLRMREILVLDSEEFPDIDEILFQLREAWGLELEVDPDHNLDEAGRRLGRTLWHAIAVVESADEENPRAAYVFVWATAASIGELQRMIEARLGNQDEWEFHGQWYALDRVAYDERPDELVDLPPRRSRSEVHSFAIEPA